MRIRKIFAPVILIAVLASCNPLKQMQTHQNSMKESFDAGNHNQVLMAFNQLENYHETKESSVSLDYIKMAAKSALEVEKYTQAEELLKKWKSKSDDFEAVKLLGEVYQKTGKNDKEYNLWSENFDRIESEEMKKEIGSRLFAIEMEKKEYNKALDRARKMPPMSDPKIVFLRVQALEATDQTDEAREVNNALLKKNPEFKPALEWKAGDIYERAEKWYKAEMSEYNKNPEYTAYVYLKRELKKISSMYRQSRDIFEKLHQEKPGNEKYIKYLKNIYLRLEMREEATKMDMLLKNQR
ncbi:tetratricopeptide repeat protein [Marinilabilia rubra]|uniref:Tetratricopeptide repeat protein n=1 Tax=Marinilabilia rubra TaxID=2162893 RepID=A0A2U2B5H0_9BACT|nr:hypothetical protein [Marinilabilia rubra]PWD98318.1 hypothetical protein DDZ16_16205 [Marinilabilia rubra]